MRTFIWFSSALAFVALTLFWTGFVASSLWLWFVVPLGFPNISTAHAIGLACIFRVYSGYSGEDGKANGFEFEPLIKGALASLLFGLILLAVGWIVS